MQDCSSWSFLLASETLVRRLQNLRESPFATGGSERTRPAGKKRCFAKVSKKQTSKEAIVDNRADEAVCKHCQSCVYR